MNRRTRNRLVAELASLYRTDSSIQRVLNAAEIRGQGLISWSNRPVDTWDGILDHVAVQHQMLPLLEVVTDDFPRVAVFDTARFEELTEPSRGSGTLDKSWASDVDAKTAEKIMGSESTLLPIDFLQTGIKSSRAVARVVMPDAWASGFLVSSDVFVTNHHVIGSFEAAKVAVIELGYDQDPAKGEQRTYTVVRLNPADGFLTDIMNDLTLVRTEPGVVQEWGSVPLGSGKRGTLRYVNIIQHPSGGPKQIALYHNVVAYMDETIVDYYTDTLPGSSGSPVMDSSWRLVAVHRDGGGLPDPEGTGTVYRNRGTHVSRLKNALRSLS